MNNSTLDHFLQDRRCNIALFFALSLLPMVFLAGMAMDYTSAELKKAQLDAAADAAAIAAVTPAMMAKNDAQATAAAQNLFNSKANAITGLNYSPSNLNVAVTDSGLNRHVTAGCTRASAQ